MKSAIQEKGFIKKVITGFMALLLTFTMMCLPMLAQTVKAEEQIKIELTYVYVNSAGDNSLYVDTQYVAAGTTWGDFFTNYQRCYNNGIIADNNAGNEWEVGVQNVRYENEEDCYSNEITNFNQYNDCAFVTFWGYPSTYKHAFISFEYYEDEECVDSGTGWDLLMPTSYTYGSDEAIAYVERNKSIHSFIEEYCNRAGASVSIEAPSQPSEGKWDGYNVKIVVSTSSLSNDSDSSGNSPASTESTYSSDSGQAMRKISPAGNSEISIVGKEEYIPEGSKFACVPLTSGDVYDWAKEIVSQKINKISGYQIFEMSLTDASDVAIHQLNGYVNVTLPIPDGLSTSNGKKIAVYRIEDDGTLTGCDTTTENGYVTFATDHFSTYVIAEETAAGAPKTGDESTALVWSLIALGMGASVIYFYRKQSRLVDKTER